MTPDQFRKLCALGLSTEQMAGVLEIFEAEAETRKAKTRERVQRWRERNKSETLSNVTQRYETLPNVTKRLAPDPAHVEDNLPSKSQDGQKEGNKFLPSKHGSRIPDDFEPDQAWAQSQGLSQAETSTEAAQFKDFWRAKAGRDATKRDWPATWRTWVRNALKRRPTQRGGAPPNRRRNFADVAFDRMNGHGSEGIFGGDGDAQRLPARLGGPGPHDGDLRGGVARRYPPGGH